MLRFQLSASLLETVRRAARSDGVSVEQFVRTALAERLLALNPDDLLEVRAGRSSRPKFEAALAAIPDREPSLGDTDREDNS